MTKEEALKIIRDMAYLSAHVVENGVEAYEFIEQSLSKPSLPPNLDEAANKFGFKETAERLREGEITRKNEGMFRWQIEKDFKAGAEWMAGQEEAREVELDRATIESYSLPLLNRQVSREELDKFARHFYDLGLRTMRKRLADPEYNREVIEKMKSEYPVDESNARKL